MQNANSNNLLNDLNLRKLEEICDFGKLAKYIIHPSEVKISKRGNKDMAEKETSDIKITLADEDKVPIIAIVNKISGGQVGQDILQSFYRYLNPIQVIDLLDEGLEKLKLFKNLKKIKIIVGGGDGTIGSILTHLNEPQFLEEFKAKASLGVLPLGTGNDFSIYDLIQ
jgi:Diacylglycerol kinase catalytic domain